MPSSQDHATSGGRRPIRVRAYEPTDHATVVDLMVRGRRQYPENRDGFQPAWEAQLNKSVNGDLANVDGVYFQTGGYYWVATSDGDDGEERIVGMVALKPIPNTRDGMMERMTVHPSFQRRGIARLLVKTLEEWAREKAFEKVLLITSLTAVEAHGLYESCGYTRYGQKILPSGIHVAMYDKQLQ